MRDYVEGMYYPHQWKSDGRWSSVLCRRYHCGDYYFLALFDSFKRWEDARMDCDNINLRLGRLEKGRCYVIKRGRFRRGHKLMVAVERSGRLMLTDVDGIYRPRKEAESMAFQQNEMLDRYGNV